MNKSRQYLLDKQRHFDVRTTFFDRYERWMDVKATSCACWVIVEISKNHQNTNAVWVKFKNTKLINYCVTYNIILLDGELPLCRLRYKLFDLLKVSIRELDSGRGIHIPH